MAALSPYLRSVGTPSYRGVAFWCPGCDDPHMVPIAGGNPWNFDGNREAPTITPSIKVSKGEQVECHVNVTDGRLHFHPDSAHALAGTIQPMVPWPEHFHDGDQGAG